MSSRRIVPNSRDQHAPEILRRLALGESLSAIGRTEGMPTSRTVRLWCASDPAFAEQVLDAREEGFHILAERAVQAAKEAKDPQLGRLAFDADRWYLGKLSNAFAERPPREGNQTNVQVNIDAGSDFGRIAGVLDRAAAAIAGGVRSARQVAGHGQAGAVAAARGLGDVADPGGPGMGEDADGG